jgi:hypothetical protein
MIQLNEQANKIRNLYPNLSKYNDLWVVSTHRKIIEEHQLITEFITQTIEPHKTLDVLEKRYYSKYYFAYTPEWEEGKIYISFHEDKNQFPNIDEINKFMDSFGYFPETINGRPYKSINPYLHLRQIEILYGSKYDNEIKNLPDALYHLTPDILWSKIQHYGLTPKNKSKIANHPERIYLLEPTSFVDYEDIALTLWDSISNREIKNKIINYFLLRIDIKSLLKEKPNFKFYKDPMFYLGDGALWVYEPIPPVFIEEIDKIRVNFLEI